MLRALVLKVSDDVGSSLQNICGIKLSCLEMKNAISNIDETSKYMV